MEQKTKQTAFATALPVFTAAFDALANEKNQLGRELHHSIDKTQSEIAVLRRRNKEIYFEQEELKLNLRQVCVHVNSHARFMSGRMRVDGHPRGRRACNRDKCKYCDVFPEDVKK